MHQLVWIIRTFSLALTLHWSPATSQRLNLALGGRTSQISTLWGGNSLYAVDGNKKVTFGRHTCSETNSDHVTWWMVDLGREHVITEIRITTGVFYFKNLRNFSVEISSRHPSGLAGFPGSTASPVCLRQRDFIPIGATFHYQCQRPVRGRYIRVVKYASDKISGLILCELEAFGPNSWRLEKSGNASYTPDVVETVQGAPTVTECAAWCVHKSGRPCRHIMVHSANGTCKLLGSLAWDGGGEYSDWVLYTVVA